MAAPEPDRSGPRGRLARAWWLPLRTVSRMLATGAAVPTGADPLASPETVDDCAVYVDGRRRPERLDPVGALAAAADWGGFVWLALHEPTEQSFRGVAGPYGLHELAAEHATTGGHRPKIEQYGNVVLFVLRTARYVEHQELTETSEVVESGEVLIFLGERFVITVRHGPPGELDPVRAELEQRPDLLRHGPWAVAHAVCDRLVDSYLDVAAAVEGDIEALEEYVFSSGTRTGIANIYQLKRELIEFRRAVAPLQRPLARLIDDQSLLGPELRRYFVDVNDHLLRTVERVTTYDELLNSILQARLAQVSVDQNNDMRKIAAWAAIAATQTAIAGVYGMNFTYMPELRMRYAYPVVLAVMLAAAVTLYRMFRRSGWL